MQAGVPAGSFHYATNVGGFAAWLRLFRVAGNHACRRAFQPAVSDARRMYGASLHGLGSFVYLYNRPIQLTDLTY